MKRIPIVVILAAGLGSIAAAQSTLNRERRVGTVFA